MNSFSKLIYELRKEKGWTQAELGEKLNLTDKAISRWETGESIPETQQLVPLSNLFDITIDELLKGERRPIFQEQISNTVSINQNIQDKKSNLLSKFHSLLHNKKFLKIMIPLIAIVIILSSSFIFVGKVYKATELMSSEIYSNMSLEEIDGDYEITTYDAYKQFKDSEFANMIMRSKSLKRERYSRLYFSKYALVVIKFNDFVGYDYYITYLGLNNSEVDVELVGAERAYAQNNPNIQQTFYCFINIPKKPKYNFEGTTIKLSEMNINFSISERFSATKSISYAYVLPDSLPNPFNVYFPERKTFEFYRVTSKEGMDEYRVLDKGLNYPTLIGDRVYNMFYNDEFFEENDLFFIQANKNIHTNIYYNITDNRINIREFITQQDEYVYEYEDMRSGFSFVPVPKGTSINNMELNKYLTPSYNATMPWFTLPPKIILSRNLIVTELSDNLTYYR